MDERLKVLVVLQMRYKVPREQSSTMAETWLAANPGQNWSTLNDLLHSSQVVVVGNQLAVANGTVLPQKMASAPVPSSNSPSSNASERMYRAGPFRAAKDGLVSYQTRHKINENFERHLQV